MKMLALPSVRTIILLLGVISLTALAFALISQYAFGYAPCELCLTQRWWHGAVFAVTFLYSLSVRLGNVRLPGKIFLLVQSLAILTCFGFAIDHSGVEHHWWHGTQACVGPQSTGSTLEDLKAQILSTPVTRCDEPVWFFLGLSMATWNAILTAGMLMIALTRLVKPDVETSPARRADA